jgi:hypothetical protein
MHRQDVLSAEPAEHEPGLFRRCVIGDPWVIGADGEDRQIDWAPPAEGGERVGVGRITSEKYALPVLLNQVPSITAVPVSHHAGAPVAGLGGFDTNSTKVDALAPGELVHLVEPPDQVTVAGLHHDRNVDRKQPQCAKVGVVHVCMGEQNQIDRRQLADPKRRLYQTAGSHLGQSAPDADPPLQCRIGQNPGAPDVEQHRCMAQPGYGEPVIGPGGWIGASGCGSDFGSRHSLESSRR